MMRFFCVRAIARRTLGFLRAGWHNGLNVCEPHIHSAAVLTIFELDVMGATKCLRIQFIPIRQHRDTETDKALRYRSLVHSEYYVQNYVQIGLRGAQNRPKIAYHCRAKLIDSRRGRKGFQVYESAAQTVRRRRD